MKRRFISEPFKFSYIFALFTFTLLHTNITHANSDATNAIAQYRSCLNKVIDENKATQQTTVQHIKSACAKHWASVKRWVPPQEVIDIIKQQTDQEVAEKLEKK